MSYERVPRLGGESLPPLRCYTANRPCAAICSMSRDARSFLNTSADAACLPACHVGQALRGLRSYGGTFGTAGQTYWVTGFSVKRIFSSLLRISVQTPLNYGAAHGAARLGLHVRIRWSTPRSSSADRSRRVPAGSERCAWSRLLAWCAWC